MSYPVYCINLKNREDRKKYSIEQFKILNINNVIYPIFEKDKRGGIYGCYDSHIKIWKDFYEKYPNVNYCLIFEDDFVPTKKSDYCIKSAEKFIEKNYNDIDILNLHNFFVPVENKLNNDLFSNGYGFATHVYFITRHYIERVYKNNNNKFPEPDGGHLDVDINEDVNNILYSEKIFFTKNICFTQLVCDSDSQTDCKSDNNSNKIEELARSNINTAFDSMINTCIFFRNYGVSDNFIKGVLTNPYSSLINIIIYILLFIIIIYVLFIK